MNQIIGKPTRFFEVSNCKLNDVDPYAYLADVIARIANGHPQSRIDNLLPWAYPDAANLRAVA